MAFESIEVGFNNPQAATVSEIFRLSIPFAKGVVSDTKQIGLVMGNRSIHTIQSEVLQCWPDGSIKWCLLYWLKPDASYLTPTRVVYVDRAEPVIHGAPEIDSSITFDQRESSSCLRLQHGSEAVSLRSVIVMQDDERFTGLLSHLNPAKHGNEFSGRSGFVAHYSSERKKHAFQSSLSVRFNPRLAVAVMRLTVRNPSPAVHPNGNWDLGNAGSQLFKSLNIEFILPDSFSAREISAGCEPSIQRNALVSLSLFQASSGGENWRSSTHIDKDRQIPVPFRGYKLAADGKEHAGLRATPQIMVTGEESTFALAMHRFWENFPKAIHVAGNKVTLSLFPEECGYLHELQGGEQKTHEFAIYFGPPTSQPPLDWVTNPCQARLSPEYYASTGAVPYLTPRATDPHDEHHRLIDSAIEGDDTFVAKREKIDEYGWRNYGDIYGDHEAVFHDGPTPLISHYNNQYDCTGAFAWQFLRTGDFRWFEQMVAMADHAWDIDTYHTDADKSLYNHGLFWHTYHYADADTGTHRSYPRSLNTARLMQGGKDLKQLGATGQKLAQNYAIGGGPSAAQNYPTGWMWAYFLTGEEDYRDAAINAAEYVIQIEQGHRTVFRWLSRSDTGYASESSVGYHGPGRASGNSLQALLTGYELTNETKYLAAAEKLIHRVAHPQDNIAALDLLNAELRWFYTMFLQALTRYLDVKAERLQWDDPYYYALATLNHYAQWMCEHERPTLEQAERLQYPTETWVAQDMRKWHVLQYAAWLNGTNEQQAEKLQKRADFFYDYVCSTLGQMPTRTLCRPVILMMQFGWQRHWFQQHPIALDRPNLPTNIQFPVKTVFVPQKTIALRRAKTLFALAILLGVSVVVAGAVLIVGRLA